MSRRATTRSGRNSSREWKDPDAANDLTFGNLDDIKAGDKSSESWESQHQAHAREREAEKAAYLLKEQALKKGIIQRPPEQNVQAYPLQGPPPIHPLISKTPQSVFPPYGSPVQHPSIPPHQPQWSPSHPSVTPPQVPFHPRLNHGKPPHLMQNQSRESYPYRGEHHIPIHTSVSPPQRLPVIHPRLSGEPNAQHSHALPARHALGSPLSPKGRSRFPSIADAEKMDASVVPVGFVAPHSNDDGERKLDNAKRQHINGKQYAKLETMTDKDLEFVLRMHLRQLEATDSYSDDYYNYAVQEKVRLRSDDSFEALAVKAMRSQPPSSRRKKKSHAAPNGSDAQGKDAAGKAPYTSNNLETLSKALGTLQVRTPGAPRKLMSVGLKKANDGETPKRETPKRVGNGEQRDKLLREDERIVLRAAIEKGYDLLASIHDVVRGKSTGSIDALSSSLFGVFCANKGPKGRPTLVVRMCSFSKGKKFLLRSLPYTNPKQKLKLTTTLLAGLSRLVEGQPVSAEDLLIEDQFWTKVESLIIEEPDSKRLPGYLVAFMQGHAGSDKDMVKALSSSRGALLLSSTMQKMYAVMKESSLEKEAVDSVMSTFCDTVVPYLRDVFKEAESTAAIWNVVAMLDALGPHPQQELLRTKLKQLLESGEVLPPSG